MKEILPQMLEYILWFLFFLRSKAGIMVRLFCAAVALVMVLTVDATPKNYNYKPKSTSGGAPSYKQDRYPETSKHKHKTNYGYQDKSYGNQERYSPRKVSDDHYQDENFLAFPVIQYRAGQGRLSQTMYRFGILRFGSFPAGESLL